LRVQNLVFKSLKFPAIVDSLGFRVKDLGFRIFDLGFRV
jgi:hypothetical protein